MFLPRVCLCWTSHLLPAEPRPGALLGVVPFPARLDLGPYPRGISLGWARAWTCQPQCHNVGSAPCHSGVAEGWNWESGWVWLTLNVRYEGRDCSREGPIPEQSSFVFHWRKVPILIRRLLFARCSPDALYVASYIIFPTAF